MKKISGVMPEHHTIAPRPEGSFSSEMKGAKKGSPLTTLKINENG
nr:hypothetical protein [uncultured Chryseobacterium sp.]